MIRLKQRVTTRVSQVNKSFVLNSVSGYDTRIIPGLFAAAKPQTLLTNLVQNSNNNNIIVIHYLFIKVGFAPWEVRVSTQLPSTTCSTSSPPCWLCWSSPNLKRYGTRNVLMFVNTIAIAYRQKPEASGSRGVFDRLIASPGLSCTHAAECWVRHVIFDSCWPFRMDDHVTNSALGRMSTVLYLSN